MGAKIFKLTREIDGGLEKLELPIPSIITCDLRLNTPRFTKIQDIMKVCTPICNPTHPSGQKEAFR